MMTLRIDNMAALAAAALLLLAPWNVVRALDYDEVRD